MTTGSHVFPPEKAKEGQKRPHDDRMEKSIKPSDERSFRRENRGDHYNGGGKSSSGSKNRGDGSNATGPNKGKS